MRVAIIALTASLATLKTDLEALTMSHYVALKAAVATKDDAKIAAAFTAMDSALTKVNEDMGPVNVDMHPDAPILPPSVHTAVSNVIAKIGATVTGLGHEAPPPAPQAGSAAASAETAVLSGHAEGTDEPVADKTVDPAAAKA